MDHLLPSSFPLQAQRTGSRTPGDESNFPSSSSIRERRMESRSSQNESNMSRHSSSRRWRMEALAAADKPHIVKIMFRPGILPRILLRGMSWERVAQKRLKSPKTTMTLREHLVDMGFEENIVTKPLFGYADRKKENPVGGLTMDNVAIKFIKRFGIRGHTELNSLTSDNPQGVFLGGVGCRLFAINDYNSQPTQYGEDNNPYWRTRNRMITAMETWLGPVPEGHQRFFHGTSPLKVSTLRRQGVLPGYSQHDNDFGSALYLTQEIRSAFDYAEFTDDPYRGAIMVFDMHDGWDNDLTTVNTVGNRKEWERIRKGFQYGHGCPVGKEVAMIIGHLSDPSKGHVHPEPRGTDIQYALRFDHGDLLVCGPSDRMKVVVFEIHHETENQSSNQLVQQHQMQNQLSRLVYQYDQTNQEQTNYFLQSFQLRQRQHELQLLRQNLCLNQHPSTNQHQPTNHVILQHQQRKDQLIHELLLRLTNQPSGQLTNQSLNQPDHSMNQYQQPIARVAHMGNNMNAMGSLASIERGSAPMQQTQPTQQIPSRRDVGGGNILYPQQVMGAVAPWGIGMSTTGDVQHMLYGGAASMQGAMGDTAAGSRGGMWNLYSHGTVGTSEDVGNTLGANYENATNPTTSTGGEKEAPSGRKKLKK